MANEGNPISFDSQPKNQVELHRSLARIQQLKPLSTYNAARIPNSTSDDITKGWKVGSKWIANDSSLASQYHGIYECIDNTAGAPIWIKMVDVLLDTGGAGDPGGGANPDPVIDNQVTRFDGTTGRIQGSVGYIDDIGNMTGIRNHNDVVFIASGSQAGAFTG